MSRLCPILVVIALSLVAGCGSATTSNTSSGSTAAPISSPSGTTTAASLGHYPAANEQAYLQSCVREATLHISEARATSYCRLSLSCIERRLSLKQFIEWNRDAILGRASPYATVGLNCVKIAVRVLRSS